MSESLRHDETEEAQQRVRRRTFDVPDDAAYFAQKHDITLEQASELMQKVGRDRDKLNQAAPKLFRK